MNWSRIVPGTIRSFLREERPLIRSDGSLVRDYIYVKDISRAYLKVAESFGNGCRGGEAFNFSTESPLTVLQIVREIQRIMKCENMEPRILNCARGEIREQRLSSEKARQILGWRPDFPLERALNETIDWYRVFLQS